MDDSPTNVRIYLEFFRLHNFDDLSSTLKCHVYFLISWLDIRLSWRNNPEFNQTKRITLSPDELWKPKLNIFNCGRAVRFGRTDLPAACYSTGKAWFIVAAELHSVCVPDDYRWFPSDTHTCSLSLGALYPQDLATAAMEVAEETLTFKLNRNYEVENPHWHLLSLTQTQDYTPDYADVFYSMDRFTFKIERQRSLFWLSFVPSMLTCVIISWASLVLPWSSTHLLTRRLILTTFAFLFLSISMSALVKTVPGTGNRTPLIIKANGLLVVLAFLTLFHTLLTPRFLTKSEPFHRVCRKLPAPLQLLLGSKESWTKDGLLSGDETDEHRVSESPEQFEKEPDYTHSRRLLMGRVCDRIQFLLQILLLVFGLVVLTVI